MNQWQKGSKGNGGKGKAQQNNPQVLEARFQEKANALYERLMDGDTAAQVLEKAWKELMTLRAQLVQSYMNAMTRGQPAAQPVGKSDNNGEVNFKTEFYNEFTRLTKKNANKDEIRFEVEEVEGGGYIANLSCSILSREYRGAEAAPSKKLAEQMAAKAAMKAENHEAFARLTGKGPGNGQGQKRKASQLEPIKPQAVDNAGPHFKERLTHAAMLLKGSNSEKGDVVYECVEAEGGGGYVATVTLAAYDPTVGYQGLQAPNKKLAEAAAAEAALAALEDQLAPLEEEHQAKRAKIKKDSLASFKQRQADKKAAQEA